MISLPKSLCISATIAAFVITATVSAFAQQADPGFTSLFNGKDLTGWVGRTNHWSVQDGCITGITTKENPAKGNNFLIARNGDKNKIVGDFELRLSFKFTGNWGNSGIQYRSEDMGNYVVHGYQADMETGPNYTGILYEEGGRGILATVSQKVVIKDKPEVTGTVGEEKEIKGNIHPLEWNDYVIIAKGNHLQHFVNGKLTVDVTDEDAAKAAKEGILALQIHAGEPMKIQFKNIRIKSL
jgi:hypothetical protein